VALPMLRTMQCHPGLLFCAISAFNLLIAEIELITQHHQKGNLRLNGEQMASLFFLLRSVAEGVELGWIFL
jgi:hypothetical protein